MSSNLNKYIQSSGISRRAATELIKDGKVLVNGQVETRPYREVTNKDIVLVDGKAINPEKKVHYLLNKPTNYLSTTDDPYNRKKVTDLIDTPYNIYPVGRLDYDASGALILTNDGELTNILTHPKYGVEKVYKVKIKGILTIQDLMHLKGGVKTKYYTTSRAKVRVLSTDNKKKTQIVRVKIKEGRNHEVKEMFKTLGYTVLSLHREVIGNLYLGNLQRGEYRELSNREIKELKDLAN